MKRFKLSLLLALIVLFCGCVRSRVSPYPGYNFAPTNQTKIQVYHMPPTVSFEIIGEVEARGAPTASWGKVENYMKKEAAFMGEMPLSLLIEKNSMQEPILLLRLPTLLYMVTISTTRIGRGHLLL